LDNPLLAIALVTAFAAGVLVRDIAEDWRDVRDAKLLCMGIEALNPRVQEAIPVPEAQMPTYPLTSPTRRL